MQNTLAAIAHRAAETVATIAGLRERAKASGVPIVTIQHRGEGLEAGTEGWRIVPELAPAADEEVVHKTSADSFLDTALDKTLKTLGVTEVVVTGFATEICVDTTARQALSHRYDLVLVADGHTTSVRPDSRRIRLAGPVDRAPQRDLPAHRLPRAEHPRAARVRSGLRGPVVAGARPRPRPVVAPLDGGPLRRALAAYICRKQR